MPEAEDDIEFLEVPGVEEAREASSRESRGACEEGGFSVEYVWRDMARSGTRWWVTEAVGTYCNQVCRAVSRYLSVHRPQWNVISESEVQGGRASEKCSGESCLFGSSSTEIWKSWKAIITILRLSAMVT